MDIQLKNLDLGYEQCSGMFTLVQNSGGETIEKLSTIVANLINHWHGSDATMHINNLVGINNTLIQFFDETLSVMADVTKCIVDIQQVRKSNGGGGEVGELMIKNFSYTNLNTIEGTSEFQYNAELVNDHSDLTDMCTSFEKFIENFGTQSGELMENWTAGHHHDEVKQSFDEFLSLSENVKKVLSDAKEQLGTASSNLQQL